MEAKQNDVIEIDVLKLLAAMWRRIWLIIAAALVGAVAAFSIATFAITPTYQSSAMMYVNTNTVNLGDVKMSVSDLSVSSNLVDYYITILKTRSTLNDVIDEAELDYSYEQLNDMISASAVQNTGIFRVTVTSTDPSEAATIANTIIYVLPERIEEIMEGTSTRVVDFAVKPTKKSAPNITKYTAIGMLLGVLLAAGIIVILELRDDVIHSGADISENFAMPVLAEIPDLLDEAGFEKYGKYTKYGRYGRYGKYAQ